MQEDSRLLYITVFNITKQKDIDYILQEKGLVEIYAGVGSILFSKLTATGIQYIQSWPCRKLLVVYKNIGIASLYNLSNTTPPMLGIFITAMNKLSSAELCEYLASDIKWVRKLAIQAYDKGFKKC